MPIRPRGAPAALALLFTCLALFFLYFVRRGLADEGELSRIANYDLQSFFLPKFAYGSKELFAGRLPLWNPYEDGGVPFFATAQPSVLYPPKAVLFALFPPVPAYWIYLALHYLALAFGFYLFVREQGVSPTAAFAGSCVWAFAVPVLASNYHPNRIANLAFLPVVFLLVERAGRGQRAAAIGLCAVVGLQFFAGYPGYVLDYALLVGVHALVRPLCRGTLPEGFGRPWQTLPVIAFAFVLGAGIAAVQLYPLFEAGVLAKRAALSDATSLPAVPARFAPPLLVSAPGLLVFGCIGLFERRAIPATAGLALCFALGQGGWILLSRVPGFSVMRFPYLWLHIAPFYVGWLVAMGWDTFERDVGTPRGAAIRRAAVVILSSAWAALGAVVVYRAFTGRGPFSHALWARLAKNVTTLPSALAGIAGALLLVALCDPPARGRFGWRGFLAAAALLVVSHQASFPFGAVPGPVARRWGETGEMSAYVAAGVTHSGRSLSFRDIEFGYTITDGLPSALGAEESFLPHRFRRVIEHFELWPLFGHLAWSELARARRFLDVLDVDLVAVPLTDAAEFSRLSRLRGVASNGETMLFRNQTRLGHAWVVYAARAVESADSAFDIVFGNHFDPRREAVLEDPSAVRQLPYLEAVDADFPKGPVRPTAERRASPEEMEYDVELSRLGVLVVSESHHPGWKAYVDGRETPIMVANYAFRGVLVPPGRHTVRFEYRPRSVLIGLAVSAVSVLLLSGLVYRFRRSARRARGESPPAPAPEPAGGAPA